MIIERIKQFIDYKGISVASFERSVGMSNASFGKSLKSGGTIGCDKLENILFVYPELSPSWLMTGRGPMLEKDPSRTQEATQTKPKATRSTPTSAATESVLLSLIREKDETIRQQAIEIGKLTEQLRSLKSQD